MKLHKIALCNAQKSLAAGAPLGELTTPPKPLVVWGGGKHLPQTSPFGVLLRHLWRLKSNMPLPKQFSLSAAGPRRCLRCYARLAKVVPYDRFF